MSGPKTAHYRLNAIRRQAEERKRREEIARRVAAAKFKCLVLERRITRLTVAVGELKNNFPMESVDIVVSALAPPQTDDPAPLEDYVTKLEAELSRAETSLGLIAKQAKANQVFRKAIQSAAELSSGTAQTAEDVLQRFLETRKTNYSSDVIKKRRAELDRILGRFIGEDWSSITPKMEILIVEAIATESETRFNALATELRHQVQEINKEAATRLAEKELAGDLLARLEEEAPLGEDRLKQKLELVMVGATRMPARIVAQVEKVIAQAKQNQQLNLQRAASCIVQEALKDLGYDITPIEDTLFVNGGKAYFRRAGWNNYCVRLMVRPEENKLNFNVVKIDDQTSGQQTSKAADIEAENAWCSGYHQLMDTFKARGLEMELVRHLPVGAVPVPVVKSEEVPLAVISADDHRRKVTATPKVQKRHGSQ